METDVIFDDRTTLYCQRWGILISSAMKKGLPHLANHYREMQLDADRARQTCYRLLVKWRCMDIQDQ